MAVKLVSLLLLWDLTLMIQDVAAFCSVTCTTDYETSLNCSCSGSAPTSPILLEANCWDYMDEVNGSCEIGPSQSWCLMYPEGFQEMFSTDTYCRAREKKASQVKMNVSESSSWALSEMVKPLQPFGVQVRNDDDCFNITWDMNDPLRQCLSYRVRIRVSKDPSKDPVYSDLEDQKYLLIHPANLQPHTNYMVDVQAAMCPSAIYKGPWSEWSSAAEWKTRGKGGPLEAADARWWYLMLSVIPVLSILLLCCLKPLWLKKLQLITYIPKPDEFFAPLYHTYGGNFKDWVKPAFSEYDVLMITPPIEVKSEKQHDILHWNVERESYGERNETNQGGCSRDSFQPHSASLLHYHEGSSLQGTGHSTGHISIHTVTLFGGESEDETVSRRSINTLRSYQDGECFGSYAGDNREFPGCDLGEPQKSRMSREGGVLARDGNQMSADSSASNMDGEPRAHVIEPERVSLDSFVSNEQSEDGYPCVDLDTIDSGFGESDCSSPVTSESNTEGRIDSDLFNRAGNSNSNYVKQWMICSTLQEDPGNSEDQLPETL